MAILAFVLGMLPLIQLGDGYSGPTATNSNAEGNPLNQVFFSALYATMAVLFLPTIRLVFNVNLVDVFVWGMTMLCIVSVVWSLNPSLTLRRSIPLVGTTILAFILGTRLTSLQQIRLFALALLVALLLALSYIVVFPGVGIDPQGSWRGFFPTKNELGRLSTYLTLVILFVPSKSGWLGRIRIPVAIISLIVIVMSSSATALFVWLFSVIVYLTFAVRRNGATIVPFGFLVGSLTGLGAILGTVLYLNFEAIMTWIGKDPTLTGRTYLWSSSVEAGLQRPFLGYGFNGFWLGGVTSPAKDIMEGAQFPGATHAHNGFIDVFLDVGGIGLLLLIVIILMTVATGLRNWLRTGTLQDAWPVAFMAMIVISNMVESIFIRHSAYPWLIFLVVAISASRRHRQEKAEQPRHQTDSFSIRSEA